MQQQGHKHVSLLYMLHECQTVPLCRSRKTIFGAANRAGQDEMAITELMPEITFLHRFSVCRANHLLTGNRVKHRQMARHRIM